MLSCPTNEVIHLEENGKEIEIENRRKEVIDMEWKIMEYKMWKMARKLMVVG